MIEIFSQDGVSESTGLVDESPSFRHQAASLKLLPILELLNMAALQPFLSSPLNDSVWTNRTHSGSWDWGRHEMGFRGTLFNMTLNDLRAIRRPGFEGLVSKSRRF